MTRERFHDLPSLLRLRTDLLQSQMEEAGERRRATRGRSRRIAIVALALLIPAVAATAGTLSQTGEEDKNVKWITVAKGTDAVMGRFEIFHDRTNPNCYGISLPDQDSPGIARSIAGTCVDVAQLHTSFVNRRGGGTFAYGVAADVVEKVTVSGAGASPRVGQIFDGPSDRKYFVVSHPERIPQAEVTAMDANGRRVGQQSAPE